ncbi:MAG: PorP/SprF family type IX secretion system membrane protein [Bacteroidetes bacterium]|nr:PorP/SprF family type IX secretion system membrane protein [Bacteroidota bacterium]
MSFSNLFYSSTKKNSVICYGLFLICLSSYSQHVVPFSQFYQNETLLNPALSGQVGTDVGLNFRSQWSSANSPFRTIAANAGIKTLQNFEKTRHLGVGAYVLNDKLGAGQIKSNVLGGAISGHIKLGLSNTLSLGLMGNFRMNTVDISKFTTDNQYQNGTFDPGASIGENFALTRQSYLNYTGGLSWNYVPKTAFSMQNSDFSFNAGLSVTYTPNKSVFIAGSSPKYWRWQGHGNFHFALNSGNSFEPSVLYIKDGPFNQVVVGASVKSYFKAGSKYTELVHGATISYGAFYRFKDALFAQFLIKMSNYQIGLSYDFTISRYIVASKVRGGPEISLRYFF